MENNIPTSNMDVFQKQLDNPNRDIKSSTQSSKNLHPILKNVFVSFVSDPSGCGHIRNILPLTYMNAVFAKQKKMIPFIAPFFITQKEILIRAKSLFFQRVMDSDKIDTIAQYKKAQTQLGYKMVYDIDDWIWKSPDSYEGLPTYNPASMNIKSSVGDSSIEIMKMMDTVVVSSEYLKSFLSKKIDVPIEVLNNSIPKYLWGNRKRQPIVSRIEKPKVIYTGSPTHYCQRRKLKGDWESGDWLEWVIKNVKDDKIDFFCMGGLPFFFEEIKDKIKYMKWVDTLHYHQPVLNYGAHFNIAPLVRNHFNFSKSEIKYQEACASGSIGIGTYFKCDFPSPYDKNIINVPDDVTIEQLDDLILRELCEPDRFNEVIQKQYEQLDDNGWYLESNIYIEKFIKYMFN